jgi:hypothetical protein
MKNPWNSNDLAFAPMFSEEATIVLNSNSQLSGTVECCAFPMEDVDPFADGDNVSETRAVTMLVKKSDWKLSSKPVVGDKFDIGDGENYKVYSVVPEQSWWKLIGRSY